MTEDNPILELDQDQFPPFVADLWDRRGWETERVSTDYGADIDVVARKDGVTQHLRTEPYSQDSAVTVGDIEAGQELLEEEPEVDEVVIVAPGQVTSAARTQATATDVTITDAVELDIMLQELDAQELPQEYATQEFEDETSEEKSEDDDMVSESVRETERSQAREAVRELLIQSVITLALAGTLVYILVRLVELL